MLTQSEFYVVRRERQDEINQALEVHRVRMSDERCEPVITRWSIRLLDSLGSRLIRWGYQLQCRCAEMAMAGSKQ
ncbi:MAG: hypothetical protein WBB69_14090 [Anaerolineales bacterium]